ncbi:MAG: XkdX family protein [Clostridia bacterium]|nr:XkdX family protein [Clostridia bacterium]
MGEHSVKFNDVKNYYDNGQWKKKAVRNAVIRGWIYDWEYEEITGEPFES